MKNKISGAALLGMPYLYQSGDPDFHMKMLEAGLRRGEPLICGLPHKAIVANKHEYWLCDYGDDVEFCQRFGLVPTYTVEDFIEAIKMI